MRGNMYRDAIQKKTGQCFVIATLIRIRGACRFVVGSDSAPRDSKGLVGRVMREIPKPHYEVRLMRPADLGQFAGFEFIDESRYLIHRRPKLDRNV
jgi:hypothetical protein